MFKGYPYSPDLDPQENVVSAAGTCHKVPIDEIVHAIHKTGRDAAQRDTQYNILKVIPRK